MKDAKRTNSVEFEKWWATASADYLSDTEVKSDGQLMAAAWIAAMEQVLLWGSDDDVLFNKIKDEIYGD